ncbi:arginine decarboxylase [Catalinimonas alkaloidigena]|uniref:Arginine decarboxylase n=1 Tax=Catalinimonas alkaloidigena TaxID=1075417 RepID=A0A1G9RBW6_9BACT|nr:arginine decarboxylase [Catalinimonas alkaloidigena]SDM20724.1 arginine decarboxylase [Catalinimonas alkaloidigena]
MQYIDLIEQTFDFPNDEFKVDNNQLSFNDVPMMDLVKEYGTPLKFNYLPKISQHIQRAKQLFQKAFDKHQYQGKYTYAYCTKSSHFRFVMEEALKNDIHLETSSSYDIPIIRELNRRGLLEKDRYIICNGFKRELYTRYICDLVHDGFTNVLPILDNLNEINYYQEHMNAPCQVGIRVAANEEPKFAFYTSRLGIRYGDIVPLYREKIKNNPKFSLKMLHFFINTGIRDSSYYWSELSRFIDMYCDLKEECPELDSVDIGGGLPVRNSLYFDYSYEYMIDQIVENIKYTCDERGIPVPNIYTEFGIYTVGESGASIYSVLDQKMQNDVELWYMIDSSFITTLPDVWGLNQKYIMMALNHWDKPIQRVNLGGLTCDSQDYYNSEAHIGEVFLPRIPKDDKLYVGFFHTGAYQETLGGYGGLQHCLIPAPQHILVNRDANGNLITERFAPEQDSESMMKILGYRD